MSTTVLLTKAEVVNALKNYPEMIELLEKAHAELSEGSLKTLPRNAIFLPSRIIMAQMPASIPSLGVAGTKIAMFGGAQGQSAILLFNAENGALKAIVAAEPITVLRTAATSAAATNVLARKDAEVLCLLGAGNQAVGHAEAICAIRPIKEIRVWSIDEPSAAAGVEKIAALCPNAKVTAYLDAEAAVRGADVVCTVTKAREPILQGEWLKPGAHVNAVGAVSAMGRELSTSVLTNGKVYVDQMETCMGTAGDLLIPIKEGEYSQDQIVGELGAAINGTVPGRENDDEITVFESVGLGCQDVVAAYIAVKNAEPVHTIEF